MTGCSNNRDELPEKNELPNEIVALEKESTTDTIMTNEPENAIIRKEVGEESAIARSGTVIYAGVLISKGVTIGHNAVIRSKTIIHTNSMIGTGSVIEGDVVIGKNTILQTGVFVSKGCRIGNGVFIGPYACLLNDKYPPKGPLVGVTINDNAIIGARATIMPGITIGKKAFVAAGALVTRNVPDNRMAIGSPAKIKEIPVGMK